MNTLLHPETFQACSRCHARKVKCDGRVPSCSSCSKHNASCNITSHALYSYDTVYKLQARVTELESLLLQARSSSLNDQAPSRLAQPGYYPGRPSRSTEIIDQDTVHSIADEVGTLSSGHLDHMSRRYVGSAAGASFARIFFKQLELDLSGFQPSISLGFQEDFLISAYSPAGVPSIKIGQRLMVLYISHVHRAWPIIGLTSIRQWFHAIYSSPASCNPFQRYVVFMIMAIGATEIPISTEAEGMYGIFTPSEYFSTAMRFLDQAVLGTNFQSLQTLLLLTIWMTRSSETSDNMKLWQTSRFALSLAIELGCHRNNPKWKFSSMEKELRNRVWWCAYALERTVAVATGRVLSIRNHAIDAPFPQITDDDALTPAESVMSPNVSQNPFLPTIHLLRLRSICGDILESVYIARPRAKVTLSMEETTRVADDLRHRLANWHSALSTCTTPDSREEIELKLELCMAVLLLNRPSPSFPNPTNEAVEACAGASREAIELWGVLAERNQLLILWNTFHDVLLTGLAWLYCAWRINTLEEQAIDHICSICNRVLLLSKGTNKKNLSFIQLFNTVQESTIKMRRKSRMPDVEPLEYALPGSEDTEWMHEFFDEVFLSNDAAFDLNFNTDSNLFRGD